MHLSLNHLGWAAIVTQLLPFVQASDPPCSFYVDGKPGCSTTGENAATTSAICSFYVNGQPACSGDIVTSSSYSSSSYPMTSSLTSIIPLSSGHRQASSGGPTSVAGCSLNINGRPAPECTATPTHVAERTGSSREVSVAQMAGIAVGVGVLAVALSFLGFCCWYGRRRQREGKASEIMNDGAKKDKEGMESDGNVSDPSLKGSGPPAYHK